MTAAVAFEVDRGVARLTLDQPDNRNALTPALLNGLGDGLARAAGDAAIRVVVITNGGSTFCSGADLSGSSTHEPARYGMAEILTAIQDCPKPVVARIAGHCMGGGVGLAAACDISVATDTARFGFTEVRIGVAPAIISVVCLPKLSRRDALALFLTGERIDADRAVEVGLITRSVRPDNLDGVVAELIEHLVAGGPEALAAAKRMVFEVPGLGRAEAYARMTELSQALFASPEAAEGIRAFREKRPASWVP